MALKYAVRVSGIDAVAITKLDVLSGFDSLKLCVAYELDGERLETFPDNVHDLWRARPVYDTMPGFGDVQGAKSLEDLPSEARAYLDRISGAMGAEVALVSLGPGRGEDVEVFDPFS